MPDVVVLLVTKSWGLKQANKQYQDKTDAFIEVTVSEESNKHKNKYKFIAVV